MNSLDALLTPREEPTPDEEPTATASGALDWPSPNLLVTGDALAGAIAALPPSLPWRHVPSLADAMLLANENRPQALLIDADQTHGNVRLYCALLRYEPAIVFVTSNPLFAHDAFEMGAVDCLAKPLEAARVALAFERIRSWIRARSPAPAPEAGEEVATRWLRMVRNGSLVVTPLDNVVYFQAERKLTRVVLEETDGYLHMGINAVAAKLDPRIFWRLHRSTIVNGRFVSLVQRDELGRLSVRIHGRPELLYVSKSHDALWRDGIF